MVLIYQENIPTETVSEVFCKKIPTKIFSREISDDIFYEETTSQCVYCKALFPSEYKNCPSCNMLH